MQSGDGSHRLARYAGDGTELQTYAGPGWTSVATDISDRSAGYLIDLKPAYNAATFRWEARFQHFAVKTVGGQANRLGDLAAKCTNMRTWQSVPAHFGAPERWNCEDGGLVVRKRRPRAGSDHRHRPVSERH